MLDKTIKELDLSPQTYMLLMTNGIKTISSLITYTRKELLCLDFYYNNYSKEEMVKEIIDKLKSKGLNLDSKSDKKPLKSEIRIHDLDIKNNIVIRLGRHGIVTLGKLSTLEEMDILSMYRIGKKSINEIKTAINKENVSLKTNSQEMILSDLTTEDIEYFYRQKLLLERQEKEIAYQKEKQQELNDKLFNKELTELLIQNPIFIIDRYIKNPRLIDILPFSKDTMSNGEEIDKSIKDLNIPGLHLGMSIKERDNFKITEEDLKDLRITIIERRIERLEKEAGYSKEELENITKK